MQVCAINGPGATSESLGFGGFGSNRGIIACAGINNFATTWRTSGSISCIANLNTRGLALETIAYVAREFFG